MDEEESVELVEQVENDEVRKVLKKPAELRQAVYEAMGEIVDSTALQTARRLMSGPDVQDSIKRDMVLGWLAHRRANKELMHKISSGDSGGISFTFNMGTDAEVENVRRVRNAFGVSGEAEDAEVRRDD
jgi:hypothetical protein